MSRTPTASELGSHTHFPSQVRPVSASPRLRPGFNTIDLNVLTSLVGQTLTASELGNRTHFPNLSRPVSASPSPHLRLGFDVIDLNVLTSPVSQTLTALELGNHTHFPSLSQTCLGVFESLSASWVQRDRLERPNDTSESDSDCVGTWKSHSLLESESDPSRRL